MRNGTLELSEEIELIAIHDGARPLVHVDIIDQTINKAEEFGAAAPAIPLKDTIKMVKNGLVEHTIQRDNLRAIQTPQVFEASLIRAALQKAITDEADITDDCSAVERMGMKVVLTEGSGENIKLTTPTDLVLANAILEGRFL